VAQAWRAEHFSGGMRYRIDLEHPAVKLVLEQVGPIAQEVSAMLRVIEETVPVQRIWLDTTEARDVPRTAFSGQPTDDLLAVLRVFFLNLITRKGLSPDEARQQLLRTEPFHAYPDVVLSLSEAVLKE